MPHKLLLADDSVTIQRVIELTFADEDIEVIAVGDGKQAIERITAERPDIVLADVGMPEGDGYDVAAFIKQNPALAHIPVVLLTGAFEPVDERRARAAGYDGVLVKPFEPQMVIERVRELLSGGRSPTRQHVERTVPSTPPQPPTQAPAIVDSLDEYFDRLDAAFSKSAAAPADVDLPRPPSQPSQVEPPAVSPVERPAVSRVEPPAVSRVERPAVSPVERPLVSRFEPPAASAPLADAFAALLAAEQGRVASGVAGPSASAPPQVSDALVEEVTRRVLERLSSTLVRETVRDLVLQVAERLVREEIEKIKQENR